MEHRRLVHIIIYIRILESGDKAREARWKQGKGSKSEAGISPGGRDEAREAKVKLGEVQEAETRQGKQK